MENTELNSYLNLPTNNRYILWYHAIDNDNWSLDSYIKILELNSMNDAMYMLTRINNINFGMFFYMKNEYIPIWEDKSYNELAFWTFKIAKNDANKFWVELIYLISFSNIMKNKDHDKNIIGISVSPKINNSIFKIWVNNKELNSSSLFRSDIKNIDVSTGLFRLN